MNFLKFLTRVLPLTSIRTLKLCATASLRNDVASNVFRPLSHFTEKEQLMRDLVRRIADEVIRPVVRKMETDKRLDQKVLKQLFETGLIYALSYMLYVLVVL